MQRSVLITAVAAGLAASIFFTGTRPTALAHCEVPCGIYTDHARIDAMREDATTIAKAIEQIQSLAGQHGAQAVNQATRWVATKEEHATRIQHTIAQYFLTQRVKPVAPGSTAWPDYTDRLVRHHAVMVAAMKTKQGVDPQRARDLMASIEAISAWYPKPGDEADHDHGPAGGGSRRVR